tara:strand:- start:35509 stop:35742 length:234 start_codon:yes stop_codon:yes gene_type:complete
MESITLTSQNPKIEKYKTGIPHTAASMLYTRIKGTLKRRKRAMDRITNFCSCLLFIITNKLWYKNKKNAVRNLPHCI